MMLQPSMESRRLRKKLMKPELLITQVGCKENDRNQRTGKPGKYTKRMTNARKEKAKNPKNKANGGGDDSVQSIQGDLEMEIANAEDLVSKRKREREAECVRASGSVDASGYGSPNGKGAQKGKIRPNGKQGIFMPASRNGTLLKMGMQIEHLRIKVDMELVAEIHQSRFDSLIKEWYGELWSKRNEQTTKVKNDTCLIFAWKALIQPAHNWKNKVFKENILAAPQQESIKSKVILELQIMCQSDTYSKGPNEISGMKRRRKQVTTMKKR